MAPGNDRNLQLATARAACFYGARAIAYKLESQASGSVTDPEARRAKRPIHLLTLRACMGNASARTSSNRKRVGLLRGELKVPHTIDEVRLYDRALDADEIAVLAGTATGPATYYEYDNLGRQTKVTTPDPDGAGAQSAAETTYTYDAAGQVITVTDPLGNVTTYEYDNLGRQTKVTQPDPDGEGGQEAPEYLTEYDAAGRVVQTTDPLGNVTTFLYDNLSRLIAQTDAEEGTTLYTYDLAGNRLSLTDAEGNTTTWAYDPLNRVTEETNELDQTRSFTYNAVGLLTRLVDRRGWVREFTFDNLYRNTAEIWYNSESAADQDINRQNTYAFTYDLVGQMLTASDTAAEYSYTYDALGRIITVEQEIAGLTPVVAFAQQYDATGNRTQVSVTIGGAADFVTETTYDNVGLVATISQQDQTGGNAVAEKYVDFLFDLVGRPEALNRYADLAGTDLVAHTDYVFDQAGRLTDLTHLKGDTIFADYDFAYDLAGELTGFDFTSLVGDAGDATYDYDATGQLTGSDYTGDWQDDEDYVYDENGNRVTANGATYVTGPNNQLLSDGTYRYEYDAEGNRTLRFVDTDESGTLTAGDTDITSYAWDHRNRLVEVCDFADHAAYTAGTPSQIVQYAYDFGNRWVRKVLDTDGDGTADSSTVFVHDDGQIVLDFEHTGTGDAAATDLAHRYLWGPAVDQLLAEETVDDGGSEDVLWALTDHLNSVRDLAQYDAGTDTTTIARHLVYDAFGNVTSDTAPTVPSLFLYTARPFDEHTGLQNNLNRWYDAQVGRWVSEDRAGFAVKEQNLYRYVVNDPVTRVDWTGLVSFKVTNDPLPSPPREPNRGAFDSQQPTNDAQALQTWLSRMSTAAKVADFLDFGMLDVPSVAVNGLQHFLGASGQPRTIDVRHFYDETEAAKITLYNHALAAVKAAKEAFDRGHLRLGGNIRLASTWSNGIPVERDESANYFGVFRGWSVITEANVSAQSARCGFLWLDHCCQACMNITFTVFKEYNFDRGESFNVPGLGIIQGSDMDDLHLMGLARNFDIWGRMKSTESFVWDLASPSPAGQTLEDRELLEHLDRWLSSESRWEVVHSPVPFVH